MTISRYATYLLALTAVKDRRRKYLASAWTGGEGASGASRWTKVRQPLDKGLGSRLTTLRTMTTFRTD